MRVLVVFPRIFLALTVLACTAIGTEAQQSAARKPDEPVNRAELRERQGLHPDKSLLFNGWGVTPAGEQTMVTDLPLKMIIAPDKKFVVAVHGGFNQHGVSILNLATHQQSQFVPLDVAWNGITFSQDGHFLFVSGGASGKIYRFKYSGGQATLDKSAVPDTEPERAFIAGMTTQPDTGKLLVCNEANNEVWVINPTTFTLEARIPVEQHPHTCVMGGRSSPPLRQQLG